MPRPATADADWNSGDRTSGDKAPEYPAAAGEKRSTDAHPVTQTATEARAGVTGHNASVVLLTSLVGVILAFVVIYVAFFAR
jgi:hypothetical protein